MDNSQQEKLTFFATLIVFIVLTIIFLGAGVLDIVPTSPLFHLLFLIAAWIFVQLGRTNSHTALRHQGQLRPWHQQYEVFAALTSISLLGLLIIYDLPLPQHIDMILKIVFVIMTFQFAFMMSLLAQERIKGIVKL